MLQPKYITWLNGHKNKTHIRCLKEIHFRPMDQYKLKVRGRKIIFHANENQKKSGVVILITDKTDFKIKAIIKAKEGHYTVIKGSIQEEDNNLCTKHINTQYIGKY